MFNKNKKEKRFFIKESENVDGNTMVVFVDSNTGVNYLSVNTFVGTSLTPLLDSNGNVIVDKVN